MFDIKIDQILFRIQLIKILPKIGFRSFSPIIEFSTRIKNTCLILKDGPKGKTPRGQLVLNIKWEEPPNSTKTNNLR